MISTLRSFISASPIAYFPVRVRAGLAKGARWTLFPFSANWRYGGNENDVSAALRFIPELNGIVFWDFGAHFGIHSIGLARKVGPSGQVVAFEPDPVAFSRLQHHIRMNGLNNVIALRAAASATHGFAHLSTGGNPGSSMSHLGDNSADGFDIETVRPDDLVAAGTIRLPNFIKIDVEGHGAEALAGSIASIRAARPIIAFSSHSEHERCGAQSLLAPLRYSPHDLDSHPIVWADIEEATLVPN